MTSSLIALILLSFCLGCGCWLFFLWGVHRGEFNDMERPKHRMLDDEAPLPDREKTGAAEPPSDGRDDSASAHDPQSWQ
ncbi:cbb3-type cytochrome oxidase assembly protein CcoS [Geomonas edaphica]|uniref:cbb3-type cytochrome oxidase assembly protein CcoS n=1 Tax=Geomonas edaphica TaxID=2570226 RepID=UPI0010A7604F|nr:cbb3-type cytochrome oxidase assembly protein CcoS [Geomonas edaphica]